MASPVRYTNGVTNVTKSNPLGEYGLLDPTSYHTYMNDFDTYAAGDWVITTVEAGAGNAIESVSDGDGGQLILLNAAGDDDSDFLQLAGETFLVEAGKKLFFKSRLKVSDATQSDFVMGLQIRDTTPLAVSDGIYFRKDDGDALIDFVVIKDSTATTATGIASAADDTFVTLGFFYNGVDEVQYYVNDVQLGTSVVTNLPDDEELAVSFGIQNGEAVAKQMRVDYILASKQR